MFDEEDFGEFVQLILDSRATFGKKYLKILEFILWTLFNTSFGTDMNVYIPGKIITSGCIFSGVVYNIYILIQILNIMNITHSTKIQYYEVMNQLDAYMAKKQFSMSLQQRLRFFYKKKFRRAYFEEDEIYEFLSGEFSLSLLFNLIDKRECNLSIKIAISLTNHCPFLFKLHSAQLDSNGNEAFRAASLQTNNHIFFH
jgi:hypothetical protein